MIIGTEIRPSGATERPMAKRISCQEAGFDCEFEMQSEDEDEVIRFAQEHADRSHDMELSRSEVSEYLQDV